MNPVVLWHWGGVWGHLGWWCWELGVGNGLFISHFDLWVLWGGQRCA